MPIVAYKGVPAGTLPQVLAPAIRPAFARIGQMVTAQAVSDSPRQTGRLAASHQYAVLGGPTGVRVAITAGANVAGGYAPYALAVHQGRGSVDIYPKRAKALRFMSGGRVVFARHVHQRARAANPWLWRAALKVLAAVTSSGAPSLEA